MKQFGKLFYRPAYLLVIVMLVVVAALPTSASAMLALANQDFNTCMPITDWTFENVENVVGAVAVTEGAFTGDSYLKLNVPNNVYMSFSSGEVSAPRLMTPISDADFEVEVKFAAPQISQTAGYKIQGMLFRDSSNPDAVEWLRVDVNSQNGVLKSYVTYLQTDVDEGFVDGSNDDIKPITNLNGGPTTTAPVTMRVKYVKATGAWTVTYNVNGVATVLDFNESEMLLSNGFAPSAMGLFVSNSSADHSAVETRVDYVHVIGTTLNDDVTKLTVNTVGNGTVTRTSCPTGVAGNVVRLQAVPGTGATFTGWSGAATGTTNPVDVTMDASKTVTATFTGGSALDEELFLPIISR